MSGHLPTEDLEASTSRRPPREFVGERLGPYRLVHQVGEGGMGQVYLALDLTGRAVAVKVLRSHIAYDADARARLSRELDTLTRVRHSRVATVIDADVDGDRPYLVTRYVAGPSLNRVVATRGPLHGHDLALLARGLVTAAEAIHAVGVVHRDIKPANVLLEDDGEPVLVDFGIAHAADDIRLTSSGLVMGTPGYLAPELIDGARVTEATDWWGWAATVAFAATGREPFGSGPLDVVISRVRRGEFDLAGVDPRLQPLLAAALSPRPEDRPPARNVLTALERVAVGPPATAVLQAVPDLDPAPAPTELLSAVHTEALRRPAAGWSPVAPRVSSGASVAAHHGGWSGVPRDIAHTGADAMGGLPGQGDPRISRPSRSATLAALLAALTAAAAVAPLVALAVATVWSLLARATDASVTSLVLRRITRGRRRSDVPRAILLAPWHLFTGAVTTVLGSLVPMLVGTATAYSVSLLVTTLFGGRQVVGNAVVLASGTAGAVLMGWWGPAGRSLRRGSRSLVRAVAPTSLAAEILTGLLVAVAAGAAVWAYLRLGSPLWWPLTPPAAVFGVPIR